MGVEHLSVKGGMSSGLSASTRPEREPSRGARLRFGTEDIDP